MIAIRRATASDLPAILRIEGNSFPVDAWDRDAFAGYLEMREQALFLVAAIDGAIAGYVVGVHRADHAEIDSIAVMSGKRRTGVAVALMTRAMALLKRRGVKTFALNVRLDNLAAIGLYRKLGFRRARRVNVYYEDGAPSWRMRKSPEKAQPDYDS